MRTKIDINSNQCDKCGKIAREGELLNCDGEAYCPACANEWEGRLLK